MARSSFLRALRTLDIEEKILNSGALVALVGVFLPWFGGDWFGEPKVWTGFGFYTSVIGFLIFFGQAFVLALTILPLMGYAIVRSSLRDLLRLIIGLESVVFVILVLSIFTSISFAFAQVGIYFGVYLTLVGSIVQSLYAFLRIQQQRRQQVRELFHHPEDRPAPPRQLFADTPSESLPPPPPPPRPPEPEDDHLFPPG